MAARGNGIDLFETINDVLIDVLFVGPTKKICANKNNMCVRMFTGNARAPVNKALWKCPNLASIEDSIPMII
eukprot:131646-Pyramimonas_sp.AAC.1